MNARAFVEELTADITRDFPVLANGLLANQLTRDDPLWDWAVVAAEHVLSLTGTDDARISECAEAFVVTSLDFLRLQARFMKTGTYAHSSAATSATLYADRDRMTEYLDGLALSYAMWPNHTRMLRYFATDFVPLLPGGGSVIEVGPGHGLLASVLLSRREDVRYTGVDISARSVEYAAAAFAAAGIDAERYELLVGDASRPDAVQHQGTFAGAICCEVLEHVDEPAALLSALALRMDSAARAFLSTVANMEAEDHVYLFHDLGHIRSTITGAGFTIEADLPLPLAGAEGTTPQPLNYCAVVGVDAAPTP
jgi:2-polyprenyl-3-methyl-5-hydroxy-6-metoxy-1,4-benzoquinol methylase